jgi:hypothetical protein
LIASSTKTIKWSSFYRLKGLIFILNSITKQKEGIRHVGVGENHMIKDINNASYVMHWFWV